VSLRFRLAFALSVILHLLLALLLSLTSRESRPKEALEIAIFEQKKRSGTTAGSKHLRSRRKHLPSLKKLVPHFAPTEGISPGGPDSGNDLAIDDSEQWGSRGGNFAEIENYNRYEKIQNDIEGLLEYPKPLGIRGIGGAVNARIHFSKNSKCDLTRLKVSAANRYLRLYVKSILLKVCRGSNLELQRFQPGQFVDLSFQFTTIKVGTGDPPKSHDGIVGNVLAFERVYQGGQSGNVNLGFVIDFLGSVLTDDMKGLREEPQ
jgi:hypothetical protein